MKLKVRNAAGEQHTIDIDACDTAIINGAQGPTTSLLDWLPLTSVENWTSGATTRRQARMARSQ
ncbi:hypothetical protein [Burkholderia sp. CCA53]|uniref:hypothetical protein n=1 Tax=Burkholderia sp. CCA53 TaxID=1776288 RepID=UPI0020C79A1B|nr:hypothetical protein [Burkholderia sp. CCA53]